jgi:hypothetical protein
MNPSPADLNFPTLHPTGSAAAPPAAEVVELALLLPRWQIDALEAVAFRNGVTVGHMIRRWLGELLRKKQD